MPGGWSWAPGAGLLQFSRWHMCTRACDQGSVWDWNLGETEAQSAWSLIWDKGLSWIVAQSGIEA